MSFLAPAMLLALPLAAIPLVLHLFAQRRYQTIEWAAMPLLYAASRSSRGYARLRQWFILAARTIAVAALLVAAARPLASSRLGITLGQADAAILLLDRSASMQQHIGGVSKLEAAVARLGEELNPAMARRWVLIESGRAAPLEIDGPDSLASLPQTTGLAASADLPAMLEAASDYVRQNELGRTELYIASDFRANDWQANSGRWTTFRQALETAPRRLRIHLLAYDMPPDSNLMIRVEQVRTQWHEAERHLDLSLLVQEKSSAEGGAVPGSREATVQVEIDGARTSTTVPLSDRRGRLTNHRIPLASTQSRGWGRVTLPADANPADNQFYFVYDQPPTRCTVIVAEPGSDVRALRLAAEIAPNAAEGAVVETYAPEETSIVPWETTALVIWQAPLPTGDAARRVEQFVARGGQVHFFPPSQASDAMAFGSRWGAWNTPDKPLAVGSWQSAGPLLGPTSDGAALPVGELRVRRFRTLLGQGNVIARLEDDRPLIVQPPLAHRNVTFWTTTPRQQDSNLGQQGVALYVAVQRAIDAGLAPLSAAQSVDAGPHLDDAPAWTPLGGNEEALSSEQGFAAGAYASQTRLWAVNRPFEEDIAPILTRREIVSLFGPLEVQILDGLPTDRRGLADEVSRFFLVALALALMAEALLSLPRRPREASGR